MNNRAPQQYRSLTTLQQLRCFVAIVDGEFTVSAAARRLNSSQPAVSKQLRLLEQELQIQLFKRSGKQLVGLTDSGEKLLSTARRVVVESQQLNDIGIRFRNHNIGGLSIGTTHTQARYVLPDAIQRYRRTHRAVEFQLHVGTSEQTAELARADQIDFAIATGNTELFSSWLLIPFYRWRRCIIVLRDHALATRARVSLDELAQYSLVTYGFSLSRAPSLLAAFADAGLTADIAITTGDADVIKTYVRLGLGVGIVAEMAVDQSDTDLAVLDASHLLPEHQTWIGFSRNSVMHRYKQDFIGALAPQLKPGLIARALACSNQKEVDALFNVDAIPSAPAGREHAVIRR